MSLTQCLRLYFLFLVFGTSELMFPYFQVNELEVNTHQMVEVVTKYSYSMH